MDDVQYALGEGPCLLAVESRVTQTSDRSVVRPAGPDSVRGSGGWVCTRAVAALLTARPSGGSDELYAHAKDAFGPEAVRIGELFARPAAVSVHNAQILAQSQRSAAQLTDALTNRAGIDQALGVIMSRTGATPEEAFDRLRRMSQSQHVKVAEVARMLLDEAVRRARRGSPGPGPRPRHPEVARARRYGMGLASRMRIGSHPQFA